MWVKHLESIIKETSRAYDEENYLDLRNDLTFAIFMIKFLEPKYQFYKNNHEMNLNIINGFKHPPNWPEGYSDLKLRIPNILIINDCRSSLSDGCDIGAYDELIKLRFFLQKTLSVEIENYGRINFGGRDERHAEELNRIKDGTVHTFRRIINNINTEKKFNLMIKSIRGIVVNELYKY